jgi:urea transport system ATP-binding protein
MVEGLNQYYGGSHILRNVALQARVGEITVVLGRNGVGKTTLLKSLMGVVPVKAGQVTLGGSDITKATSYERVRRRHRLRAAGPRDLRPPDGGRQPAHGPGFAARRHGHPAADLRAVPRAQADHHRRGGDLSGGQQQQLAIGAHWRPARAC